LVGGSSPLSPTTQSPSNRDFPVLYENPRIGRDSCAHFVSAGCRLDFRGRFGAFVSALQNHVSPRRRPCWWRLNDESSGAPSKMRQRQAGWYAEAVAVARVLGVMGLAGVVVFLFVIEPRMQWSTIPSANPDLFPTEKAPEKEWQRTQSAIGTLSAIRFAHGSFARFFNSANARPARRPSLVAVVSSSSAWSVRPASNAMNHRRKRAS
jgi:hypothetical protein